MSARSRLRGDSRAFVAAHTRPGMTDSVATPDTDRGRRRFLAALGAGATAALAGCSGDVPPASPAPSDEGRVTVRISNRDDRDRKFEVAANRGDSLTDSFSGVLPAGQTEPIELVATFRITDEQYDFAISTPGGRRGRTWDPTECADLLVEAFVEDGEPSFDADCRAE